MIIKGQKVVIEFFVLVFAFEFGAVLRLCGVEKELVEHLKYKLQSVKYKIQNAKYNVLRLCGVEKGGEQCHKWPPWKRTTPLTTWLSI